MKEYRVLYSTEDGKTMISRDENMDEDTALAVARYAKGQPEALHVLIEERLLIGALADPSGWRPYSGRA